MKHAEDMKNTKSISMTTSLPKYNIMLIFALTVTFLLIIIHPIANEILTVSYLNEESLSLKTTSKFHAVAEKHFFTLIDAFCCCFDSQSLRAEGVYIDYDSDTVQQSLH